MCFSGSRLGENIINTLPGSCVVDKMAVCLCFYLQRITITWLFVPMSVNKQSIYGNSLAILAACGCVLITLI